MTAPDGHTYQVDGPEGANDDQVRAEILRQNPTAGSASVPEKKPGPFKAIADAIYPPAPRAPEGLVKPALRTIGAIAGAPQRAVENATGLGSGTMMEPALQKLHDILNPPQPYLHDFSGGSYGQYQAEHGAEERQQWGEMGKEIARTVSDPLTYAGTGLISGTGRKLVGVLGKFGEAAKPVAEAVKAADQLELPLNSVLHGPPTPAGQMELPGMNLGPSAEDILRARRATTEFHANAGLPSPAPVNPDLDRPGYRMLRAITGLQPEDWINGVAKWKAKIGSFTPEDISRGIPAAQNIVREAYAAQDAAHQITQEFGRRLQSIYKGLGKPEIEDMHRLLDNVPTQGIVTPEMAARAGQVRAVFNKLADMAGLPQQQRLADYFPHLRDEVSSTLNLKLAKGGGVITKEIPQDFKVFFQRQRTLPSDETLNYGTQPVQAYLAAAAKRIAMKGGTLSDGRPVAGLLNRAEQHLQNLPEVEDIQKYFKQYVNDLVHGQKPGTTFLSPQTVQNIKQVQFLRTIGANLMSPTQNLMQTMNTLSKTDIRSWGAAWYDLFNRPEVMKLARESGLVDQTWSAHELTNLSNPNKLQVLLNKGADRSGYLFKKAEEVNRLHAFAAGYRDAERMGLAGNEAVNYAKDIVNKTQFRFGAENLPPWLRGSGAANALVGQYKSYQINQALFLKDLALHDPKGLAKWATAGLLLGGPDIYGHPVGHEIRKGLASVLGGDPKDYKMRGLLGGMGMWVGNQLGLGALPAEDMSGLAFLLPGPAAGHVMSVASALSGKDYTAQGLFRGNWGKELSPDQRASNATSSVNVQLNRLRQALVLSRAKGPNFQQSSNMPQAFGLAAPTGPATTPFSAGEVTRKALGIPSVQGQEDWAARERVTENIHEYKDLVRKKAAAIQRGDAAAVKALNEEGIQKFGKVPAATGGAVKQASQATKKPALEREVQHSPKQIRQQQRKEAED